MRRLKEEIGLSLIELALTLAITAIIAVPLTKIFGAQLRLPANIAREVTSARQLQKSTLILIEDARSAQSFTPGTEANEYGTFAWTELAGADPILVTSRYSFVPAEEAGAGCGRDEVEEPGVMVRELNRGEQKSPPILIIEGIFGFCGITFEVVDPLWSYDSATSIWSYTEGKIKVKIVKSFLDEVFGGTIVRESEETLIGDFRPQIDRPVDKPSPGGAEGTGGF